MPRISLPSRSPLLILWVLSIALLAATAAVACGGDDGDDPEPPAPPAAADQSGEEPDDTADDPEDEPARTEPQQRAVASDQADEQAEADQAAAQAEEEEADTPAVAQAEEQAEDQAADQAEDQAEEQPAEPPAEEAAEEVEEADAPAGEAEEEAAEGVEQQPAAGLAEDDDEEEVEEGTPEEATEDEAAGDGKDIEVIEDIEDAEPTVTDPLVAYAPVEDVRFEAVIKLDIAPNEAGDDAEFLALFSDITAEGVYLASGDHEISIRLGESSFLPPMGIVSIGDTLYTNLGFGWEMSEGSTGALVEGLGADLLGLDLGGLDLGGLLTGGDIGVLLSILPYEAWEDRGAEELDGGRARIYTLRTDSLADLFLSLGEAAGEVDPDGDVDDLGLEMFSEFATLDSLDITLWIDDATGAAARLALAIDGLSLSGFAGPDGDLRVGALALQLDVSPHFGLLTSLRLAVEGLDIPGPGGMSGSVAITLDVTEINAGDVVIEPPN